jgi:hypothetical protein
MRIPLTASGVVALGLLLAPSFARGGGTTPAVPVPASPFPNGLSPQWLNAADVDPVACLATLKASGAKYRALPPQARPDRKGCGMPHGVIVFRGPTGIVYSPPLAVDCSFAVELGPIEDVIQDEARRELSTSIARIDTLGGYACVTRAGPYTTRYATKPAISEHAFGLAYDLRDVVTKTGRTITVLRDYEKDNDEPRTAAGRFLYATAWRLRRETHLTHVLTPDFNADHRNHFHLDRGLPFGWWWDS